MNAFEGAPESRTDKIKFFSSLAMHELPAMRLLLRGGKLGSSDGWRNVAEHCLTELAAAHELSGALGLSEEDSKEVCTAAACHDWKKHLEKRPDDFSEEEQARAAEFLAAAAPNPQLMDATTVPWLVRAFQERDVPFREKLLFYIDETTMESDIVPFERRIAEAEARGSISIDPDIEQAIGGRYREKERELANRIQADIFARLRERRMEIERPEDVPAFIKALIEKAYGKTA